MVGPLARNAPGHGPCAVCGLRDLRALVMVELRSGIRATLCGSHELMFRREGESARTIEELKSAFAERRESSRRAHPIGEVDELAENLSAAFRTERRGRERRAS